MTPKRVVITGMAGISSLGHDWDSISANLRARRSGIRYMPDWERFDGLNTRLAGPVTDFIVPAHYSRKKIRSMGRVSLLATVATERALQDAGLLDNPIIKDGRMGISYGASAGSMEPVKAFGNMLSNGSMTGITSSSYIQMMAHTAPVNVGVFFELKGRVITTSSACTSGSQGIGYAYEAIKYGKQKLMVAGGAEELSGAEAAVFDTLFATSTRNEKPELTPRPFDRDRDGLVVGEGAGSLILEELEHAQARGAKIHAELVGYGCNSDGAHITQPEAETMATAMRLALDDAGLAAAAVGYVNAHGTATERGDVAESHATAAVFGKQMPISSLKSYFGHTLGACGALEAWLCIEMMNRGWFAPTINLDNVDPNCAELDYLVGDGRQLDCEFVMSNNFAFGGINTSLVLKRWS
ncbi:beta-ketoacyl-ACP synthase [Permianibacter sp. IMCC34836]|uniref:beta-ketoacyl-ACP synthase n=1 Tax=Permianibacter fluminis TaxID=2738515 RepID=UPI001551BD14|nr:beta-ketoacyl-ACP synthase [Permianibacter fluminis]NQD35539.1 beta-ketoacyl-ACP synthase [Permianibacter fluminis]